MLDRVLTGFLTIAVAAGMTALPLPGQAQPAAPAQNGQPQWKDRAEYDLFNTIVKEQTPAKKIELLNSWKEKYPTSAFGIQRQDMYCQTYAAMNQPQKVMEACNESLQADPKDLTALFLMAQNVLALNKPEDLALGEKAANGLLTNLDTFFDPAKKPTTTTDAQWAQAKTQTETLAHTALGWIALQKKDNETAEKEFALSLKSTPNNAQVSYWVGTAILAQKKPERQSEALYHFARAASLDQSQGGFNAQARQSIDTYFVNAYNRYHGQDPEGLKALREQAKAQPFPPAGFKIENVEELKAKNEEEFKKKNPGLALWMNLKQALTAADGDQYFNNNMKGAEVPGGAGGVQTFKGKLISSKPALHPKELILSIGDGTTPDATLVLDAPLPGKAEPGIEIEFAGVPTAVTKDPYNITFDVEKKKIAGWTGKDAAPVRHHPTKKKG